MKLDILPKKPRKVRSLPSRERGLKQITEWQAYYHLESLPSRERGLKLEMEEEEITDRQSLPSRERGLKHHQ